MSSPGLLATVFIPTYNREKLVKEAIESLFTQTVDPQRFELIVVDNCSSDNTEEMVRELQAKAPFSITFHRNERNLGCFGSMNLAAAMAKTDILASLDSDAYADPNWLRRGIEGFGDDPKVAFVSGHIADKPDQPVTFFSTRNGAPKSENLFYPSGNCFYRKSVLMKLGGFDEQLSFGDIGTSPLGCADTDLCWRMKEAGYSYAYRGDAIVYHEVTRLKPIAWLKHHWRVISIPYLVSRHPGLRQVLIGNLFFLKDNILFYLMLLSILLGLTVSAWTLLLAVPYLLRVAWQPDEPFSLQRLIRIPARVGMLTARQFVISASLVYGSIRARTVVL
jgi:glycosyltransferase involved in cell wall biosynthesis